METTSIQTFSQQVEKLILAHAELKQQHAELKRNKHEMENKIRQMISRLKLLED